MRLLTEEFCTIKEIAHRRQTTTRAVRKTIQNIRRKGGFGKVPQKVPFSDYAPELPGTFRVRLHGERWRVVVLQKSRKYVELSRQQRLLRVWGNTVLLHRDVVQILSGQDIVADTAEKADFKSMEYWARFGHRLENDLGVTLIKDRAQNWRRNKAHYARWDPRLCRWAVQDRKRDITVYGTEDGKLWLRTDESRLQERETQHPVTASRDDAWLEEMLNKYRDGVTLLPKEMQILVVTQMDIVMQMGKMQLNMQNQVQTVVQMMETMLKFMGGYQKPPQDADSGPRPDYFG